MIVIWDLKNPPFPRFPQLPPGRPPHTLWLFHGSYCDSFWLKHNLLAPDHLPHVAPRCTVSQQQQHPSALPHGRQPPRNYLVFVPEIPLAAHLSDPNTLLCVSIRLQCTILQMGWNVSSILSICIKNIFSLAGRYCSTIIFSVFWCRVVVFSELCNNAILPVQCNPIGRTGMHSLPRFVNYKPLQCRYSLLQRNLEQYNTNPMQ